MCLRLSSPLFWLAITLSCRGREIVEPLPRFLTTSADSLIAFQSPDRLIHTGPRIHLVDPGSASATELDQRAKVSQAELLRNEHMVYGAYAISRTGQHAILSAPKEDPREYGYHDSVFSPNGELYLRNRIGRGALVRLKDGNAVQMPHDSSRCAWQTDNQAICQRGKFSKVREIVLWNLVSNSTTPIYSASASHVLDNLVIAHDRAAAYFTEKHEDTVSIRMLYLESRDAQTIASFQKRYIHGLVVSTDDIVAARIVNSEHAPGLIHPYDIWISKSFGGKGKPGYLLDLPTMELPGFFSGEGFRGVDSMAFSPDGKQLAILMSEKGGCRMVDEGGNLGCRQNIYVVELSRAGIRKLTDFKMTEGVNLRWARFTR